MIQLHIFIEHLYLVVCTQIIVFNVNYLLELCDAIKNYFISQLLPTNVTLFVWTL